MEIRSEERRKKNKDFPLNRRRPAEEEVDEEEGDEEEGDERSE